MTLRTTVRILAAALLVGALPAHAAETGGCGAFAWPIEADKTLLSKAERTPSGATIDVSAPKAFRIEMTVADKADFAVAPGRPPAPGAPAGTLTFTARAGLYQFTMTDRVWIDLVQAGRALPEAGFSGVLDCDGARKSVRFELADGPVLIQLSGSPARTPRSPSRATRRGQAAWALLKRRRPLQTRVPACKSPASARVRLYGLPWRAINSSRFFG